jgi:AraC-like DNA-binding protein
MVTISIFSRRAPMRTRQSNDFGLLLNPRLVEPGEVEKEIYSGELHCAPEAKWTVESLQICERIYCQYVQNGNGSRIPQSAFVDVPKWIFAEYAVQFHSVYLFGDQEANLDRLPRSQPSLNLIGWNRRVYVCHSSSMEAIFHAIIDDHRLLELDCPIRSTISLPIATQDCPTGRFYFGLDYRASSFGPWSAGELYFFDGKDLPTDDPHQPFESSDPIRPKASVSVVPLDWPMLDKVDSVDVVAQNKRCNESYVGFPWRADEMIHPHVKRRRRLASIRREIDLHPAQPLSLRHLGTVAECSPFTFLRNFRAEFGVSPHQYQDHLKVHLGKIMLKNGVPIAEVAQEAGFYDQSHFTSRFRRAFGLTPSQYASTQ